MTKAEEFDGVYRSNFGTIYRYCRRLTNSRERAQDLTQDTFFRAFRSYEDYQHQRHIRNWLMRIATNSYLDNLRRIQRRPKLLSESMLSNDEGLNAFQGSDNSAEAAISEVETRKDLENLIRCLDPDSQRLIRLAYKEELPHAEIARIIGTNTNTIRSRLHRIRQRMRELLTEPADS